MARITVGDVSLYVERHGDGHPVFLISGLGGLSGYWQPQIDAFSRGFSLVLHDHRGVGRSEPVTAKYTIETMAEDVVRLMDRLEIERAHIIGHSTGGAIAQALAIDHPGRVSALVIAAGWMRADAFFRRQFALRREILERLGPQAYVKDASLMLYPAAWIAANDEALSGLEAQQIANFPATEIMLSRIDAIMAFDRSRDLGRIKAPTLIVGAADDAVTPPQYSEALARSIPEAELKLFAAGGHCFSNLMARDFNQAVLPFLEANTLAA